jgi:hypothetical protein
LIPQTNHGRMHGVLRVISDEPGELLVSGFKVAPSEKSLLASGLEESAVVTTAAAAAAHLGLVAAYNLLLLHLHIHHFPSGCCTVDTNPSAWVKPLLFIKSAVASLERDLP